VNALVAILLAAHAYASIETQRRMQSSIESSANRIGTNRREVDDVADFFHAESMAVGDTGVAGAVAAEVAAEPAVAGRRIEIAAAGDVVQLSRQHPVANVFGERGDVDQRTELRRMTTSLPPPLA
jgi:hypothetical protein